MSYYYNYFIGYKHNGKIYPLGPYTAAGKRKDVISRSRNYASELHEELWFLSDDMISDELRKEYEFENYEGNKVMPPLKYMELTSLPKGSYIRKGYFLIKDVDLYEKSEDPEDLFYESMSPAAYAAMAKNEMLFGEPEDEFDCEGEKIERHSAGEYMFYAYPDYSSKEYEAEVLRTVANMLHDYSREIPEGAELVVIEDEG